MSERIYVGVDLGGTTVKVGICNADGELIHKFEGATEGDKGSDAVIDNIVEYVKRTVEESDRSWDQIAGVGAGVPGFLDIEKGFIKVSPNLPFRNVPLKDILEQRLGLEIRIDNDANVAALGEAWSGAGAGYRNIVCFTLGTGVGGGIIINGNLYQGSGMAGELGHIQVVPDLEAEQCGCGQTGCLETVSSATGIIRMAEYAVERGERTTLNLLDDLTAKDVFDAAKTGDEVAIRIVNRAALYLGKAMSIVGVVLNPERYVIGGGVSRAGDILFKAIEEVYRKYTPQASQEGVDIVPAILGNDAGVIGAAGLNLR